MIAELVAINAAIAVIKETANHGKDIISCGQQIASFFDNKTKLEKRVQEKGQSDMEAYLALVEAKQAEAELREILAFTGHLHDFYAFQRQRKEQRKKEHLAQVRAKQKKAKQIKEIALASLIIIGTLSAIGILVWLLWLMKNKGAI